MTSAWSTVCALTVGNAAYLTSCADFLGGLFMGLSPVGWCLAVCLWLGPPWFGCWFSFALAYGGISHENSSLFNIEINLILCFRLGALTELGAFVRTDVFVYFCVRGGTGAQGGVAWCYFILVFFSPFSIAITSLGKERANVSAFCILKGKRNAG